MARHGDWNWQSVPDLWTKELGHCLWEAETSINGYELCSKRCPLEFSFGRDFRESYTSVMCSI